MLWWIFSSLAACWPRSVPASLPAHSTATTTCWNQCSTSLLGISCHKEWLLTPGGMKRGDAAQAGPQDGAERGQVSPAKISVSQQRTQMSSCPQGRLEEGRCRLCYLLRAISGRFSADGHELQQSWQVTQPSADGDSRHTKVSLEWESLRAPAELPFTTICLTVTPQLVEGGFGENWLTLRGPAMPSGSRRSEYFTAEPSSVLLCKTEDSN